MDISLLDWLGYIASLIVLISLVMSSIIKLRWINLIGAILFSIYGFLIGSMPTGLLNLGIVFIDAYYIIKIYKSKEYFHMLQVSSNDDYLKHFTTFYKENIISFFGKDSIKIPENAICFYVLRNMVPASIFVGVPDGNTLKIQLDYVTPEYRDFKLGNYFFNQNPKILKEKGYTKLQTSSENEIHNKYLIKMGFKNTKGSLYEKGILAS